LNKCYLPESIAQIPIQIDDLKKPGRPCSTLGDSRIPGNVVVVVELLEEAVALKESVCSFADFTPFPSELQGSIYYLCLSIQASCSDESKEVV
jgi:hypothetical protein